MFQTYSNLVKHYSRAYSTYLEPVRHCSVFGKQFQAIIIFPRSSFLDHFKCLAGFSIRLCIHRCYLTCAVILCSVSSMLKHIQTLFKDILPHIQNIVYPYQIQNSGIFRLQGIFILSYLTFSQKLHPGRLMQF